ncbi:MAG: hypothetical protein KDI39_09445 [Pseudomonadales bacterium]|nr:hypothetical protein [Pseudomonadales bacterium]
MDTTLIVSLIGIAVIGGTGFYLYEQTRKKVTSSTEPKTPKLNKLEPIIKQYEQECLHYFIFAWGNRKRISTDIESQLKAKYPLVLALPILELSQYFPNQKNEQRQTVLAYLKQYNIQVDDWTPETIVLKNYIQQKAEQAAEQIVDAMISSQTQLK